MSDAAIHDGGAKMTFFAHLAELRRRLLYSLALLVVVTLLCMSFAPELFVYLRRPLSDVAQHKLIVLSPIELYITYLKLALLAAVFLSSPFLFLQLWLFVAPGLRRAEKRWILPFVVLGSAFFVGGGLFAFEVVMPLGFKYLIAMMPAAVESHYSVAVYFSMVTKLMLAFGIVFELPLVMWFFAGVGLVDPGTYARLRRYFIVIAFVVAAILTPPDPLSQCTMAIPLLLFYELGVLGARFFHKRRGGVLT